jgi:membrane peptidoglycan carboxypeptidase
MGFRKIAAGKTGTTNDKRDAWFIGFTPKTLALTWVGFDDNDPTGLSGSDAAVPMWTRYMLAVTAGEPNMDFAAPAGISIVEFDKTSGGLATPYCPRNMISRGAFKSGTEPTQPCQPHTSVAPPSSVVPMYDEFGNLIVTGTATMTDTSGYTQTPPDSTLTGGVFQPQTQPPVTQPPVQPPPTTTTEQPPPTTTTEEPPPEDEPPPATDTSTTTSAPP